MGKGHMGRAVWVEMGEDRSAVSFSPRKGIIVHLFDKAPEKQAAVIELVPPPLIVVPRPTRLKHIIVQYHPGDAESLQETFESGHSYAEVLRPRRQATLTARELLVGDASRLGFASEYPWPRNNL